MSAAIKDGGPAFPVADYDHQTFQEETMDETRRLLSGMSLRDYFAARAMQGFAADSQMEGTVEAIASLAYRWADAMLKERTT